MTRPELPQAPEAEAAVLGCCLLSPAALDEALEALRPEDFHQGRHQLIFAGMRALVEAGAPVDRVVLAQWLRDRGHLERVGGGAYLAQLDLVEPSPAHVGGYIREVWDKALLRALHLAGREIARLALEPLAGPEALARAEDILFGLGQGRAQGPIKRLAEFVGQAVAKIEERSAAKSLVTGLATGFHDLDGLTAGLQPQDLIVIAGRPSMGKTALAMDILDHAAKAGVGGLAFSLEMSGRLLAERRLSREARIDARRIRTGWLQAEDWPKLTAAAGVLAAAPVWIDESPSLTVAEVRSRARMLARREKLGLVVVDYLQLAEGREGLERREREVADISRNLKAMAKELNLPVIAVSQLSRKVEERANKRPMLADLRESGAIEQDADVIMFLYRDEVYNPAPTNPKRGLAEVIVAKQRNGPTGVVELRFDGKITSFMSLAKG